MIIQDSHISAVKPVENKPAIVQYFEWCKKITPPPFYCESLDDFLKIRPLSNSANTPTYSYTSSMVSLPSVGTPSTTTT